MGGEIIVFKEPTKLEIVLKRKCRGSLVIVNLGEIAFLVDKNTNEIVGHIVPKQVYTERPQKKHLEQVAKIIVLLLKELGMFEEKELSLSLFD